MRQPRNITPAWLVCQVSRKDQPPEAIDTCFLGNVERLFGFRSGKYPLLFVVYGPDPTFGNSCLLYICSAGGIVIFGQNMIVTTSRFY